MTVVTVSPKYQVVIPKDVREKLKIRPGQKVEAFAVGNRVELVPVEPIQTFRGKCGVSLVHDIYPRYHFT
jgi:AbrB family looped-hinge helix DNA binding protein